MTAWVRKYRDGISRRPRLEEIYSEGQTKPHAYLDERVLSIFG